MKRTPTIEEEARDYKIYLSLLRRWGIEYPVKDEKREELERLIADEYKLIIAKSSALPSQHRRVICRIVEMHEARKAEPTAEPLPEVCTKIDCDGYTTAEPNHCHFCEQFAEDCMEGNFEMYIKREENPA